MRSVRFAQCLFAIAAAGLALFSLAFGDFAPGGSSFPAWIPWRETLVHVSALIVLAAGAGLCFSRTASRSALTIGAYLAAWAVIRVPQILSKPLSVDGWYGFVEALSSLIGTWILYAMIRGMSLGSEIPLVGERATRAAQVLFGLTCVFYGWSHFAYAEYTATMVPTWLPHRLAFAYFTGLGHLAAGVGIVVGVLPRLAAVLEAIMMGLFGLLVWVPSFFSQPRPDWAMSAQNQWSELVVTLVLAASAWIVATSLRTRPGASPRVRACELAKNLLPTLANARDEKTQVIDIGASHSPTA
jgi:uncharacterized membrane protein YphA (DoxX/SURF4 family)